MQPLDLNLSSHPFRNNTLLWAAHVAACASLLAFSAWNVSAFLEAGRSLGKLRGQVAENDRRASQLDLREKRADAGIGRHDLKDLSLQSTTANDVILMRALSWTRLFNLLEKVVPYEVKTTAIRPTFGASAVRGPDTALPEGAVPVAIQGTAQSLEAFLEFERALLMDAHFDEVEPEKSDIVEGGEVAFEVRFLYFPEGRGGRKEVPDLPHVLAAAAEEQGSADEAPPPAGVPSPPPAAVAVPAQSASAAAAAKPEPEGLKPAAKGPGRPGRPRAGGRRH
ncbi:MAG: hypothetical protein LAO51_17925 [Acidobacteriia bacterium]|nr:hypothetical protein [Terriglobia bacterium]